MANGDGSGWWRQSRRHHDAALKGREGKHRSRHDRAPSGISEEDLDRLRNGAKRNRTKWALKMDQIRTAGTIYDPRDPKQVKRWRKHADRADLDGVDTAQQQLYGIKVRATAEVERRKELVKRAVDDARKRLKNAREGGKTGEEASEAEKGAVSAAKEAIERARSEVNGIIEAAKEEQDYKIRRYQGKWDAERKRRAEIVAHTVGCSMFEADALIQRAKRAGFDYDVVNWDSIQGKDLEYSEWVEKLDRDLNKETTTKTEEDHMIDWQMAKAQDEWEVYVKEQEEQLLSVAQRIRRRDEEGVMEERDYQISFGDPPEFAENDLMDGKVG